MKKLLVFGYTMQMGGAEKALSDTLNYLKDYCEIDYVPVCSPDDFGFGQFVDRMLFLF